MQTDSPRRGYYFLVIHLDKVARIRIGALGEFLFKQGYYIYVGSALNGLDQRVSRHMRPDKPLRWHIDYLLQNARVVDTLLFETPDHETEQDLRNRLLKMVQAHGGGEQDGVSTECLLAQSISMQDGASEPVPGFGSSDCRCRTHLFFLADLSALQFAGATH